MGGTLADVLAERAAERGDAPIYTFLGDGINPTHEIGYAAMLVAAASLAGGLCAEGIEPGERALLFAYDPIEFMKGFMACQLAGVVAVPVAMPTTGGDGVSPLRAVAEDCAARAILADEADAREPLLAAAPEFARLAWLTPGDGVEAPAERELAARRRRNALALLQYTSGSTGDPKGVMVTHEALLSNLEAHRRVGQVGADDVFVEWLPLFHDMGLIAVAANALNGGARAIMLAPELFVMRPLRWLAAITRYRGTITHSPDFGYRHCVERSAAADREQLELSSWRVAATGAEPVRTRTLDQFTGAFAPYGFDERAWFAGYGLAECTVMATAPVRPMGGATRLAVDPESLRRGRVLVGGAQALVACGSPQATRSRIEIVDPGTHAPAPPGRIGEIWIAGPSVCAGYWSAPEATQATFAAALAGEPGTRFLRTGDLGFVCDEQLYVTGRLKEIIVIAERNHYPYDIEATVAAAHPAVSERHCVAFAVERDDAERLVLVVGLRDSAVDHAELVRTLRAAVSQNHGIVVADLLVVPRRAIARTTSGKLRRAALREAYLAGELTVRGAAAPRE